MDTLKSMATGFAKEYAKKQLCSGDVSTIKQRAIKAIQMMPDAMVSNMIKSSPICSSHQSMNMNMFGGKQRKTRRQRKSKAKKTRKH
jgi:hypothetical protein